MDYLLKCYFESCKKVSEDYGFKKVGRAFVRIKNDVVQNFAIEKLRSGRACRVEFAIIPLCLRIEATYVSGGVYSHSLRKFEPSQWTQWDQWEYDPESKDSVETCVAEITRFLTGYLFPFFERAISCETALQELIELEKFFCMTHRKSLRMNGFEDKTKSENQSSDSVQYFMALKAGNYDLALKNRQLLLQQNMESYHLMMEKGYLTAEDRLRRENNFLRIQDEINHLCMCDVEYFRQMMEENEAYSREVLKGFIK